MKIPGANYVCRDAIAAMTDYLEGAMSPGERAVFEQHLMLCDPCKRYLAELRETIRLAGEVRADESAIPPETKKALVDTFRTLRPKKGGR